VSNGDDTERAAESNAFFGGEATPEATGHHDFFGDQSGGWDPQAVSQLFCDAAGSSLGDSLILLERIGKGFEMLFL
jgi:hypothetical protein